jgi:4-alpha-glucanotransferase
MSQTTRQPGPQAHPSIIATARLAGVALHFTSLPRAWGCGDIGDAAASFIDLLAPTGLRVWQFLPIGPTAYGDSPYQPLSVFAGNELLIGLEPLLRLGLLRDRELDALAQLPAGSVDYRRVIPARQQLLRQAAGQFQARRFAALRTAYEEFLQRHEQAWLHDYALFRLLKSLHGERAWTEWEPRYRRRQPAALRRLADQHRDALERIRFAQFLFDQQWHQLRQHAADKGMRLFGDMPIYLALDSADAWAHPELLQVGADDRPAAVAGVPPDYFSADGQLWGNPLYDWAYHRQSGYRWWIDRMQHAAAHMDLLRVDHFRGFESFWSIPAGEPTARNGHWEPGPGDALFDALRQALGELPIVAEDLGMITPEVQALRLRHGIPGMRVLQFEATDPDFDLNGIEENCVCYTGTHDNDTTLGWFRGSPRDRRSRQQIERDRQQVLQATGGAPRTIHLDMIRLAFASRAALAIAPLQDYLGLGSKARLNTPGTTGNNWRWRLRAEQLSGLVLERVTALVADAGRAGCAP